MPEYTLYQWATVVIAIAAIVALFINAYQLKLSRDFQKQAATKVTYREYLKLSIEYPQFGDGSPLDLSELERSRYEWFVSFFLLAAEEVVEYAANDKYWVNAIKEEISRHRECLSSAYYQQTELPFYSRKLQRVVRDTLAVLPDRQVTA
jgi:hypothetical protein